VGLVVSSADDDGHEITKRVPKRLSDPGDRPRPGRDRPGLVHAASRIRFAESEHRPLRSKTVAITNDAAGQRFGIAQSPTGIVYVVWKDTDGSLRYAVAGNKSATRFGKSVKLATRGEIEYPQIAVNSEGAGRLTWTDDRSPSHVSALPIVPRPKVTRAGVVSLQTPRECVAIGGRFPVSLRVSGKAQLAGVRFSLSGSKAKAVARSPYRATLTLKAASKAMVIAQVRLSSTQGHTQVKSIRTTLTVCP
jgi:hypothetical protein